MTAGPSLPRLHVVTDDAVLARTDLLDRAGRVLAAGARGLAFHLRGPRTSGRRLLELAEALAPRAAGSGALFLVNDRADVARLVGADGVHLGERSLPVADARKLLPPGAVVGASAHDPGQVGALAGEGADYTFLGTIYATPSHPGRPGAGAQAVETAAVAAGGRPVLAIGGVTVERVAALRAAGAYGVAVLRGIWDASDPVAAVADYLMALDPTKEEEF